MRQTSLRTLGVLVVSTLGCATASLAQGPRPAPPLPADLVFRGAVVHTSDPGRPVARAVAVHAGRIVYVGVEAGLPSWIGANTRVIDLRGGALLPGLHDSHVHPAKHGVDLNDCLLHDDTTRALVAAHIARCVRESPSAR